MKIARFEYRGTVAYGSVDPGKGEIRELDRPPFEEIRPTGAPRRLADVRLLAPVVPSKIVAIGLIYKDHAREMRKAIPEEPLIFLKAPSALNHPGGDVVYPRASLRVDHEAELAVIIGTKAKDVSEREARPGILGDPCFHAL